MLTGKDHFQIFIKQLAPRIEQQSVKERKAGSIVVRGDEELRSIATYLIRVSRVPETALAITLTGSRSFLDLLLLFDVLVAWMDYIKDLPLATFLESLYP